MGFIIEVGLTIAAWRKGWGWKALIPLLVTGSIAFGSGFVMGLLGTPIMSAMPFFILMDILCIIVLIVMVAKPHGYEKVASYEEIKNLDKPATPRRAISSYGDS